MWQRDPRPDTDDLPSGARVSGFAGLELGKASIRLKGGSSSLPLVAQLRTPLSPGHLEPKHLELSGGLRLEEIGHHLGREEARKLRATNALAPCSICLDDLVEDDDDHGGAVSGSGTTNGASTASGGAADASLASSAGAADADVSGVFSLECGHRYHAACLQRWLQDKQRCPECGKGLGKIIGSQPARGWMSWTYENYSLPGHPDSKQTIVLQFVFPEGADAEGSYEKREPRGYLPANLQGILLLELFKVAFRRRVMFGIGQSMTFNRRRATFNIHIKTSREGGMVRHGFPDEGYFGRALDELKARN